MMEPGKQVINYGTMDLGELTSVDETPSKVEKELLTEIPWADADRQNLNQEDNIAKNW